MSKPTQGLTNPLLSPDLVTPPKVSCQRHSWDVKTREMQLKVARESWRHYALRELVECKKCDMRKWRWV